MGFRDLWKISEKLIVEGNIQSEAKTVIQNDTLLDKTGGIDALSYLCTVFYTLPVDISESDMVKEFMKYMNNVRTCLTIKNKMRQYKWYFDGKPLSNKSHTSLVREQMREQRKNKAMTKSEEISLLDMQIEQSQQKIMSITQKKEGQAEAKADEQQRSNSSVILHAEQTQTEGFKMDKAIAIKELNNLYKQSQKIPKTVLAQLQETMKLAHHEFVLCKSEADFDLANDALDGTIDIVFTQDSDSLASVLPNVCRYIPLKDDVTYYIYHPVQILNYLQWSKPQWVDFCLLLGKDQDDKRLSGIGPVYARFLIHELKSIETVLQRREDENKKDQQSLEQQQKQGIVDETATAELKTVNKSGKRKLRDHNNNNSKEENLKKYLKLIQSIPEKYTEYLTETRSLLLNPSFINQM